MAACAGLQRRLQDKPTDSIDTKATWGLHFKVQRCRRQVAEASEAVAERERQITAAAEVATADARQALDAFITRNLVRHWSRCTVCARWCVYVQLPTVLSQAAIEGNQDAEAAMEAAKAAVLTAETALQDFHSSPGDLGLRDAFVVASVAVPPAMTTLTLYSKAAVSAACVRLAEAKARWHNDLAQYKRDGDTAHHETASKLALAAESALAKAESLQARVVESMEADQGGASPGAPVASELDDELLAAVPAALSAIEMAAQGFVVRDATIVKAAEKRLGQAVRTLNTLQARNTASSRTPTAAAAVAAVEGSGKGALASTGGLGGSGDEATSCIVSAASHRPSLTPATAVPDRVEEYVDSVAGFVSAVESAARALDTRERTTIEAAARHILRAKEAVLAADTANKAVGAPASPASTAIATMLGEVVRVATQVRTAQVQLIESTRVAVAAGVLGENGGGIVPVSEAVAAANSAALHAALGVAKAKVQLNQREAKEAASLKGAKAELMRLRGLLETLRKRNRAAGIPDDRASAFIEAASLAVVTAETLHRLVGTMPAVAGMGRQFIREVPTATAAVQAAEECLNSRDRDAEAAAVAERARKQEEGGRKVSELRGALSSMQERYIKVTQLLDEDAMARALAGLEDDVDGADMDDPPSPILPPALIEQGNALLSRVEEHLHHSEASATIASDINGAPLEAALTDVSQCDALVARIRRKVAVLEQAARRAQSAEVAAAVAHAAGVLAVARSKLQVLQARNHTHGAPSDEASTKLERAMAAVAYARSFEKTMAGSTDPGGDLAEKFLQSAHAAVADVQSARRVRPC